MVLPQVPPQPRRAGVCVCHHLVPAVLEEALLSRGFSLPLRARGFGFRGVLCGGSG